MDTPLTVIIGYGPGLGAAIARRFLAGGHQVLGLARDPARHAPAPIPGLSLAAFDAADPAALGRTLAGRRVRALVYNAYRATMAETGPAELAPADLMADFQVNVAGALAAARAVLPGMRDAGQGSIIFTGGGLALDPTGWPAAASLAIGKAGLRSLSQSLHAQLAPLGLHAGSVTVAGQVAPGTPFDPDRIAEAFWEFHQDPPGAFRPEIIFRG